MWQYFMLGIGLLLVFEGILPFMMPERYKQFMRKMAELPERSLRLTGLILMLVGLALLIMLRQWFGI